MNRVHRLIWNECMGAWVAVAETARSRGKRASGVARVAAAGLGAALSAAAFAQTAPSPSTLPTGGTVVAGAATLAQSGATLTITQSSLRGVIDWTSFNLGRDATVNFVQPSSGAATLNRVLDPNPSQIFGRINANGQVFLTNPAGIYFGRSASANVGALTATTHAIGNDDFMAGQFSFTRNGATGSVVNEGSLSADPHGYIALLAPEVRNHGVIVARMGTVALAAGEAYELQFEKGLLAGISVAPAAIRALVENGQAVQAPGGQILLSAQAASRLQGGVVNNAGSLEATGLVDQGGVIRLLASDRVSHTGSIKVDAAPGTAGNGGTVTLIASLSEPGSVTEVGGSISARGGDLGGHGGFVETSASHLAIADSSRVSTEAPKGRVGQWLLDPVDFTIGDAVNGITGASLATALRTSDVAISTTGGTVACAGATCGAGSAGNGDIFVIDNVNVTSAAGAHSLTLQAARNIVFTAGKAITDEAAHPLTVNLQSGGALVFADNTLAAAPVDAINIHGNLNGGGLSCTPGAACTATGNGTYAMGVYVGKWVRLNTNGADINLAGKAHTAGGSAGGTYANNPLGLILASHGQLNGRNVTLYGESGANFGIQINYGDTCVGAGSCTPDTLMSASGTLSVTGKATAGNNTGIALAGSTSTAPTIHLTGVGSGSGKGLGFYNIDVPVVSASTALTLTADSLFVQGAPGPTLSGGGALTIEPFGTSFASAFAWPPVFNITTPLGGLTLGKAGNAADISVSGVHSINGPVSLLANGTGGDITLAAGSSLTASAGNDITLAAGGNFVNSSGSSALNVSGGGRWLVYSSAPATDTFGGLLSGNLALWGQTYGAAVASAGNRYLFATQPSLTVTALNQVKTYGQTLNLGSPVLNTDYSVSGLVNAATYGGVFTQDSFSGTPALGSAGAVSTASVAGSPYAITPSAGSFVAPATYGATVYVAGTLTVNPSPLVAIGASANNLSKLYGQPDPALTWSLTSGSLAPGDSLTGSLSRDAGENVGSYAIRQGTLSAGPNYTLTFTNGTLTINKAHLTVTPDNQTRLYGQTNPVFTQTISGFVNGDTAATAGISGSATGSSTATAATGVGAYAITGSTGTLASANYDFSAANGTLTINKAHLTVTPDSQSRLYGQDNPIFTQTISGFVNGENAATAGVTGSATGTCAAAPTTGVGLYRIAGGTGTLAAANYDFTPANGTLTINRALLTVTPNPAVRIIGEGYPKVTYTITGYVNGESAVTAGLTGEPSSKQMAEIWAGLGTYPIFCSPATLDAPNYDFTATTGVLTIVPKPPAPALPRGLMADAPYVVWGSGEESKPYLGTIPVVASGPGAVISVNTPPTTINPYSPRTPDPEEVFMDSMLAQVVPDYKAKYSMLKKSQKKDAYAQFSAAKAKGETTTIEYFLQLALEGQTSEVSATSYAIGKAP